MASTRGRPNRSAWARRSVGVSTSTTPSSISSFSPGRQRLFLGLSELQTRHGQPITGMPVEVPLPSMVTRRDMGPGILPHPLPPPPPDPGVEQSPLPPLPLPHPGLMEVPQQQHVVPLGQPPLGIGADGRLGEGRAVLEV